MANDLKPGSVDPREQTQLSQFLTYRLSRLQTKLNMQATRILRDTAGITLTHWRIIVQVGSLGSTTAAELSRLSAMDKGLISRNMKTMVSEGLVDSKADKRDTRVHHLVLTPKGQQIYDAVLPVMRKRQDALRGLLSKDELDIFTDVMSKLETAAEDPAFP